MVAGVFANSVVSNSTVYLLYPNGQIAVAGAASTYAAFYLNPADYAISGRTTNIRLSAVVFTNAVAPVSNITLGLYPIATFGGASAAAPTIASLSAAVMTAAINAPAATSANQASSAATAFPAAGFYAVAVTFSAVFAANAQVSVRAKLQAQAV